MKGVNQGVLSKHQENHLFLERNKESESSKSAGDLDEDARLEQNEPDRVQARSKRDQWSKKMDFIIACVGGCVGLGNIWRFPYLCYKNGGGAFLIPYLICLATCGLPLFMLELVLGQYMSIGSVEAWARLVPAFKGIGIACMVVSFQMNIYYIVIMAWDVYYLLLSFTSVLPWSHCNNEWNTDRCSSGDQTTLRFNGSKDENGTLTVNKTVDAVIEFWEYLIPSSKCLFDVFTSFQRRNIDKTPSTVKTSALTVSMSRKILQISDGIQETGNVVWELAIALLFVWMVVFVCVCRGIRWTGKIVYFTALFPYIILTILLVFGLTLDGAGDGIYFYLKPDLSRLSDPQVWLDGGSQVFFSYLLAVGAIVTLGSYNKFHNNIYRDCFVIATINSSTSLYGGFAVFSVLGFMAKQHNVTVGEVAKSGPGLVFIAYPKAIAQMPASPFWAILFFFMILLVGLDSQFIDVEGFLTPIIDAFPRILYSVKSRVIFIGIYCALSYLLGLTMVTEGGMYVFQLFDYYSASGFVLLIICFFESIAVAWAFGAARFNDAIELMIGRKVPFWFVLCWKFITPVITLGITIFMAVAYTPRKYASTYTYPTWAQGIGFAMALSSISCIPLTFLYKLLATKGSLRKRWRCIFTSDLQEHQIPDSYMKPVKQQTNVSETQT